MSSDWRNGEEEAPENAQFTENGEYDENEDAYAEEDDGYQEDGDVANVEAVEEMVETVPWNGDEQAGMIRCEVTGKMVRPEDAVEFQGKTVSAEGKNILVQRMLQGGAAAGQLERPTFLRRFGCYILDNIITGVGILIISFTLVFLLMDPTTMDENTSVGSFIELCNAAFVFMYVALMHAKFSQTLGKMAGGFKVVNLDGSPITAQTAFIRAFWSIGINMVGPMLGMFSPMMGGLISVLIMLYNLANCLTLAFDKEMNRALHDRLAGTRVVMKN